MILNKFFLFLLALLMAFGLQPSRFVDIHKLRPDCVAESMSWTVCPPFRTMLV